MAAVSDDVELTGKLVDTVYKNILNKFNPAARQLVAASKGYLKTLHGVASASQTYLDALSKLSEIALNSEMNAAKDIGESLADMVAAMLEIRSHEMTLLKAFNVDVISPLEDNVEKDYKVVQNQHKQFISRWRSMQERYQRAEADVKKRQRKMKNNKKNATLDKDVKQLRAYEHCRIDYESFLETSLQNVLVQERRRYGFVLERQCSLSRHYRSIYNTGGTILEEKLPHWTRVYDQRESLTDDVRQHLHALHYSRKSTDLAEGITGPKGSIIKNSVVDNIESPPFSSSMVRARSTVELSSTAMVDSPCSSTATGSTIKALYSFQADGAHQLTFMQGDLLLPVGEANNGWQFGRNDRTNRYGWFPVRYTNNIQYDIGRIELTTSPANEMTTGDPFFVGTLSKTRQDFVHDDTVSSCQPGQFCTGALTTFTPQTVTSHRTSMTSSASIMTLAPGYVNQSFESPENTLKMLPPRFSVQQELNTRLQQRMSRHKALPAPEGELSPPGPPTPPSVDVLLNPPTSTQKHLTTSAQKQLPVSAQKQLPTSAQKQLSVSSQKQLTTSAQKQLPTSAQKQLSVSSQKQLPTSAQKQLSVSSQKQLTTSAQKQLPTSAQKQLSVSSQKQLTTSVQKQWPTAAIESRTGNMRRSQTTPVIADPSCQQNSLHSSNDSGFGADPAARQLTDLQIKTQSREDSDRSWILFSRCSNNKDLLRPFLSEHNSDVTAKKSTDEVRSEGHTSGVRRLTDHFVTIDRRNSKQNRIPRTLQQRVSRKCSLLKDTLSMAAISNKLSIAPSNSTSEKIWLKEAPPITLTDRSSPRSLSESDLLELDADDSFLLVQEHRALAAPTDTHQSHLSGDSTTISRQADGNTTIIHQNLHRFSIDPFDYGSYLRRRLHEQDDFTTEMSRDVTKLAFDDVSTSAAQYSPWCDLWTDRRAVVKPSANQSSPSR